MTVRNMSDASQDIPRWRRMRPADLTIVCSLANEIHSALKERCDVFAEKLALFPDGCFALTIKETICGYAFAHPWTSGHFPKLDTFLGELPADPTCLFLHDVVIAPGARGTDAVSHMLAGLKKTAREHGLALLSLVSVYGTHGMWRRHGFEEAGVREALVLREQYGADARYMTQAIS